MAYYDLSGVWQCEIPGQEGPVSLPGTLDESGLGFPDDPRRQWKVDEVKRIGFYRDGDPIVTRLTRKRAFEGQARIWKTAQWPMPRGKRLFLECGRARHLRLFVNGREAPLFRPATLSTPYCFEITGLATGRDEFLFLSDNSYPGWPRDAIVYSSAASDETQTNWNGLLGFVRIRAEEQGFISDLRVYPHGDTVDVCVELALSAAWKGGVTLRSDALCGDGTVRIAEESIQEAGRRTLWYTGLPLRDNIRRWDLEEGSLYALTAALDGLESKTVFFGARDFEARDGHFALNGRRIFLRGEANCAVFPETGYAPMDKESWLNILNKYRAYGVNCMRFHSHCPPEAAFAAADEMGMLMQPELSHWDPNHAFETQEARDYYETEFHEILRHLANHPSFVMLTFGNELHCNQEGRAFMTRLLQSAPDQTRLYANGSNPFYGALGPDPASGFYTSTNCGPVMLRAISAGGEGWLNREEPDFRRDYGEGIAAVRKTTDQPVFSFEVGQYEVLPDFDEIADFRGVTSPENFKHIQRKVKEAGISEEAWRRRVAATGESSLLCYRAEAEAAMRTAELSGISLLGIQDFPGQGTALVGMMNAHLAPKPYAFARPERFRAFFRDQALLALLPRFTYFSGETLAAQIKIANYGKTDLSGAVLWTLTGDGCRLSGALQPLCAPAGGLWSAGELAVSLPGFTQPVKLALALRLGDAQAEYPLWVYPEKDAACPDSVHECRQLDDAALAVLAKGGRVLLAPDNTEEALPHSIPTLFSPDFWSVCTFPFQAGGMGQLIDSSHPLFRLFPTEDFSNWQWKRIAVGRALLLPHPIDAIITEMDSYAFLRPMAKLFECRCGGGRLMVSSLGLHRLDQYPEARALRNAIYAYMASDQFAPKQEFTPAWIRSVVTD